jgi:hypothetical protein
MKESTSFDFQSTRAVVGTFGSATGRNGHDFVSADNRSGEQQTAINRAQMNEWDGATMRKNMTTASIGKRLTESDDVAHDTRFGPTSLLFTQPCMIIRETSCFGTTHPDRISRSASLRKFARTSTKYHVTCTSSPP